MSDEARPFEAAEVVAFLQATNPSLATALTRERLAWMRQFMAAKARAEKLEKALRNLQVEVKGVLGAFELELREAISNTNVNVLHLREAEARAALEQKGD